MSTRTLQAYGSGKSVPLIGNPKGEKMVNSCMKVQVVNVVYGDINDERQWNSFVQKFNEGEILH